MEIKSAVILAGGKGTRLKELTSAIPKPMVNVLAKPLVFYIIDHYVLFGVTKIYLLTGYKHSYILNYFKEHFNEISPNKFEYSKKSIIIEICNTGVKTMTGGRVKKVIDKIDEQNFYLTYGDGISNVDLNKLRKFHYKHKPIVTITAVRPPARFGSLNIKGTNVNSFGEKKQTSAGWINGGFFIVNKKIDSYLRSNEEVFEGYPLEKLAATSNLAAFKHYDIWQCADTLREIEILEEIVKENVFFKK
jgi:glucose-1-phosphate cytidylyltransferase